ncbi:hypothetical protein G6F53_013689 [Rhizopus delemar]|nr:hypothetical protein G6F53_013689 [Rhizopus delemar]
MTRTISKSVQNQIQLLLASNMAYEQVMERISGLKKSTLGRCTNKFFPNRMKAAPGRRATIGETTYINFRAKINAKKPLLSKQHKERRLAWAMAHKV